MMKGGQLPWAYYAADTSSFSSLFEYLLSPCVCVEFLIIVLMCFTNYTFIVFHQDDVCVDSSSVDTLSVFIA